MSKNYYDILGVSKSANVDEIKSAYRRLALKYHPDRGGDAESEKKFKEANEAYQVLSDPQKRSRYDQFGDAGSRPGAGSGGGFSGFDGFDFSGFSQGNGDQYSGFGGFGGGLGDIFEDFFGSALSQVQAELKISPAQAVLGDKIKVDIGGEKMELNIPAGVQDGTSFRFQGKGKATRSGKKGDLILTVRIEMPHRLTREQKELWERLKDSENKKSSWWNA